MYPQHIITILLLNDCNLFNFIIYFSNYLILCCFFLLFDLYWFDWSCMRNRVNWIDGFDCFTDSWILLNQILNIVWISNSLSKLISGLFIWQYSYCLWHFDSLNKFNLFCCFIINENKLLLCTINWWSNCYIFLYIWTKCFNCQCFNLSYNSSHWLNRCNYLLYLWHLFSCNRNSWSWNSLNVNNWSLYSSWTCFWYLSNIFGINNLYSSSFYIEEGGYLN